MPPLRGLLRVPVLRAGALHPAAVVLLVPPHDGRPLLLRSRLLHPEAHVPAAADRGARLQRVLLQAAPEPGASPCGGPRSDVCRRETPRTPGWASLQERTSMQGDPPPYAHWGTPLRLPVSPGVKEPPSNRPVSTHSRPSPASPKLPLRASVLCVWSVSVRGVHDQSKQI
ncbi:vesicular, overexpressed in cancer, prosurvival protein 1 isoform X2 [Eptesicus fuscus]|uniref:vesicular, overexpressed in cancer, prosurvival protein 1 isoform X2 n=1 Tax=Eptesicus fuscus TaxID=29078 RepID=UPI002403E00D|nr:vesicular, overexpressed in cancer, prosurvival protein 1 isoform X2 [Eptesicus fuscus]